MSCPNVKVKFVKMSDTKFYCCDKLKQLEHEKMIGRGHDGYGRVMFNYLKDYLTCYLKYCPFCGTKLSINHV